MSYGCVTNRSKELILYGEPGYRVLRTVRRMVLVQREVTHKLVSVGVHLADRMESKETYWQTLTVLEGYSGQYSGRYRWTSQSNKLKVNKEFGERGEAWIQRWKNLVAGKRWEVRCDDWDGQGTPCPLQREMKSGKAGCPIHFFFHGYSGCTFPSQRSLPGVCDGPLNSTGSSRITAPRDRDEHGFNMQHLAMARHEIDEKKS